jgi:hypothetical protein
MQEMPEKFSKRAKPSVEAEARASCWRHDWFEPLPAQTQRAFDLAVSNLDICYSMMSVVLDEAIRLRANGELVRARAQAGISGELVARLADRMERLLSVIDGLGNHAPWTGELRPQVAPLNTEFFRHAVGRESARGQSILHFLVRSARMQFRLKVHTLRSAMRKTSATFQAIATDISEGTCVQPRESWNELEELHYDLNTCLREAIVQLKFLLRALPADDLAPLIRELSGCPEATVKPTLPVQPAALSGQSLRAST